MAKFNSLEFDSKKNIFTLWMSRSYKLQFSASDAKKLWFDLTWKLAYNSDFKSAKKTLDVIDYEEPLI